VLTDIVFPFQFSSARRQSNWSSPGRREHIHRARGIALAFPVLYSRLVHEIIIEVSSTSRGHGAVAEVVTPMHFSPLQFILSGPRSRELRLGTFHFENRGWKHHTGIRHRARLAGVDGAAATALCTGGGGKHPFFLRRSIGLGRSRSEDTLSGV
jgi:hypothetical protein